MCNGGEMSRAFRRDIVQASRAAILNNSIVPLDLDIRTLLWNVGYTFVCICNSVKIIVL